MEKRFEIIHTEQTFICENCKSDVKIDVIDIDKTEIFNDALTTIQKCDLIPSELLAQRDELLECLKEMSSDYTNKSVEDINKLYNEAQELINKTINIPSQSELVSETDDAYCPNCEAYIVNERVTFEECCDNCGAEIEWHSKTKN